MISPQPTERTVRRLRRLCILLLAMVLLCGGVFAVESSPEANAATIKSLETEYTIAQDGSCTVLLRADMTFSAGVSKFSLPVPGEAKHLSVSAPNYSTSREGGAMKIVTASGIFSCTWRAPWTSMSSRTFMPSASFFSTKARGVP